MSTSTRRQPQPQSTPVSPGRAQGTTPTESRRSFLSSAIAGSLIALTSGCVRGLGPSVLHHERFDYNQQVVRSNNEQMLLNLVRLRYNDTPLFLELGTIVAQYALETRVGGGGNVQLTPKSIAAQADGLNLSAGANWAERPTMTYTPLNGDDFATRMLSPISTDAIVLLSQSGWSIERLMRVCVQRINEVGNAATATGPTPEEPPRFQQMAELAKHLRQLQKAGLWAISHSNKKVPLFWLRKPSDEDNPLNEDIAVVRRLLELKPEQNEWPITAYPYKRLNTEIGLRGRTMLGVMYYLSQSVEPPPEHAARHLVGVTKLPDGQPFDWTHVLGDLLRIKSSPHQPNDAFIAIKYRTHWFYIEDTDRDSKTTFNMLILLFMLQSASSQGKSPLLTLPIGN